MQKRIIRIMLGCKSRVSCGNLFRTLEILPFVSQYILSLMLFVVKNKHLFILNSENRTKSTRQFNNFYQPITNLAIQYSTVPYNTIYQREVYCDGGSNENLKNAIKVRNTALFCQVTTMILMV